MGILEGLLGGVWNTKTKDWAFIQLEGGRSPYPVVERELTPRTEYVNVMLRTLRIPRVTVATSRYLGLVHGFMSLQAPTERTFHVVTAPANLRSLDKANLDRVIQLDQRLLGPTPYWGGDMRVEMALFSVKIADLATPYVDLLGSMSTLAGTAFLGAAAPVLPLLKQGVTLLTQATDTANLEIGIDCVFSPARTGTFLAVRAPASDASSWSLASDGRLKAANGTHVTDFPYFVFTVEGTKNRNDWASVPDLKEPYQDLLAVARKGNQEEAKSIFEGLKRRAYLSPDVLPEDADEIVKWVEGQLRRAFPGAAHAAMAGGGPEMEPLTALPLYARSA